MAPTPAIVTPGAVPQSPMPVASTSDPSAAWPTASGWQHAADVGEPEQGDATTSALSGVEARREPDRMPAPAAGNVQPGPVVNGQLVSRSDSRLGSRSGHQNAVKMIAAAVIAVAIVTALALTRDPSARSSVALSAAAAAPAIETSTIDAELPPPQLGRESRDSDAVATPVAKPARAEAVAPERVKAVREARLVTPTPAVSAVATPPAPPVAAVPEPPVAKPVAVEPTAAAATADASRTVDAQPSVTITGCLETDGERFRLTETDGAAAPKSRGWKSGFLKKKPAPVELVALSDAAALRKYVGHRVVATGPLESRALQVRSFRDSGAMCD